MTLNFIDPSDTNNSLPILQHINQIDIEGQAIGLQAAVRVSGSVNLMALNQQIAAFETAKLAHTETKRVYWQIGIDEAGRGPLLGDVVVSAVLLPQAWSGEIEAQLLKDTPLAILTDSKQLSEKKRDKLYPLIQSHAIAYISTEVPAAVIDQLNILQATMLGMRLCSEQLMIAIVQALPSEFDKSQLYIELLYDGNRCPKLDRTAMRQAGINQEQLDQQAWVKGDGRHTSIAAASVIAKVGRDLAMMELAKQYPHFGIEKHKGYPTKAHLQAIDDHGVLPEHRRSFGPVRRALEA